MALIPEALLDEIQSRVDIAEIVGNSVKLVRSGKHFKARCPFHKEKTPSFIVNTDKQIFHCFGCGAGGNVFGFLMQHDRMTFPEAVRLLAEKAGVELPKTPQGPSLEQKSSQQAVLEQCCRFFEKTLAHPENGKRALEYIAARGVSQKARFAFRIGLALDSWDRLLKAAQAAGVSVKQLEQTGLVVPKESGYYDRFRDRLIFPIFDVRGRVLGFGGRSLGDQQPKYLNSPETSFYQKGSHLYGLFQAKDAIVSKGYAIIVEGYFDCVVLASAGIEAVVSPSGTALTPQQVRLLKRYTDRVVLAFDADAAGQTATRRSIDLLVEAGMQVSVLHFPDGMDPDEYILQAGTEVFERKIQESQNVFEFLLEAALQQFPEQSIEDKVRAARQVLPTIAKIDDSILQSEYVRLLAGRLHLDELAVLQELNRLGSKSDTANHSEDAEPMLQTSDHRASSGPEQILASLVLENPQLWEAAADRLNLSELDDPLVKQVLERIGQTEERRLEPAELMSRMESAQAGAKVAALVSLAETVSDKQAALEDCIKRIQGNQKQRRLIGLRSRIRVAQDAGQSEAVFALLAEYQRQVKGG